MEFKNLRHRRIHLWRKKSKLKNDAGFSLIELVFSMGFLTLIVLGVVNLQSSNLAMISSQNNQIQANFWANQGVSIIKAIGYSKDVEDKILLDNLYQSCSPNVICKLKINSIAGQPYNLLNADPDEFEAIPNSPFERYVEIDPTGLSNAYKATVFVEWDDSTGPHRRVDNAHAEAKIIIFDF